MKKNITLIYLIRLRASINTKQNRKELRHVFVNLVLDQTTYDISMAREFFLKIS